MKTQKMLIQNFKNDLGEVLRSRWIGPGAADGKPPVLITGASPVIHAERETLYICTEPVSALTVSELPAEGLFEIVFRSGNVPTELTLPGSVCLPEGFTISADTSYDLSIRVCGLEGTVCALAAVQGWPVADAAAADSEGSV